ncbi:MAG: glycosyltransferase [Bacilli bacterium]|nr:glycosyltransferase [Bacilli bacterium]
MMEILKSILQIISYMFIGYSMIYTTIMVIFVIMGWFLLYKQKQQRRFENRLINKFYLPISIIVPAYNEEYTIIGSIKSLLKLDYNLYEIVVIDDGSKDETSKKVIEEFHMHKINRPIHKMIKCQLEEFLYESHSEKVPITLVRKKNGGVKADAINMGINVCKYPYFICMDADSVLQNNSLKEIATPVMKDDSIVAVGGAIRILNDVKIKDGKVIKYRIPRNWLSALQVVEYDRTFASAKFFFNKIRGNAIISGAFGLFKKDIVIKVGGYDSKAIGEDMDLVMSISGYCMENHIPYNIDYVPSAICWTQAPESLRDIKSQRTRWHIGMRQNIRKCKRMIGNPKYGSLGTITIPIFLLFELFSPTIEVVGMLSLIIAIALGKVSLMHTLMITAIYSLFGIFSSIVAFSAGVQSFDIKLSFKDILKVIGVCLFELLFMHPYLLYVRLVASYKPSRKKIVWKSLERKKIDS